MSILLDTLQRFYEELVPKMHSAASIADIEDVLLNLLDASFCVYNADAELVYSSKNSEIGSNAFPLLPISTQSALLHSIRSLTSFCLNVPLSSMANLDARRELDSLLNLYCSFFPILGESGHVYYLVVWKPDNFLTEEDAVLCSGVAMAIGMLIGRNHDKQFTHDQTMRASAQAAVSVLSYSEHAAIQELLKHMDSKECTIVISDFANKIYVTRSVISSALRKMESSDVFFVKSLGMRGTYIRINNPFIYDVIEYKEQNSKTLATSGLW